MATRLERHIHGRAPSRLARSQQSDALGMRSAIPPMIALPNDFITLNDHAANQRIGFGIPQGKLRQFQGPGHVNVLGRRWVHRIALADVSTGRAVNAGQRLAVQSIPGIQSLDFCSVGAGSLGLSGVQMAEPASAAGCSAGAAAGAAPDAFGTLPSGLSKP